MDPTRIDGHFRYQVKSDRGKTILIDTDDKTAAVRVLQRATQHNPQEHFFLWDSQLSRRYVSNHTSRRLA